MKSSYITCAVGTAFAIALLSGSLTAQSPEDEPEAAAGQAQPSGKEQKLVRIYESSSMLMKGDPQRGERERGDVLPGLLAEGWRIVELHADATGQGVVMITTGYLLLER